MFVEREMYLRSGGRVRFVRLTREFQVRVAVLTLMTVSLLVLAALALAILQWRATRERDALLIAQSAVAQQAAAIARFRRSSGNVAADLLERQAVIEGLVRSELGEPPAAKPAPRPTPTAALPDDRTLAALAARQEAFAARLATTFDDRSRGAEETLRRLGFDTRRLSVGAQGGPLIPLGRAAAMTPALRTLAASVARWAVLRDNLVALPSSAPTDGTPVTSSYGVRGDPFTGAPAFHAGLDFIGRYRQPIRAAAPGRVVFVGQRSGYGNVVEIDHGHGLLTRYAHLSGFDVAIGRDVTRGSQIGRMGSTGRSTGTHLHFEVRVNGAAVNPKRFLTLGDVADVQ